MVDSSEQLDDDADEQASDGKTRQRSTIGFPYTDFDNASGVAHAIHSHVGRGTCSITQLGPWMNQSPKSSSFRVQLAAARLFGLIDSESGDSYRLTSLGARLVDPVEARSAKAESFLKVPLFNKLFQVYQGSVTPPAAALEREIAALGVSEKQKARARQVFESSAVQTGFREHGPNRLVLPAVVVPPPPASDEKVAPVGNGAERDSGLDLDPLLIALLQKIPRQGEPWPQDRRLRWFRTFAMNVSQVYDTDDQPVELLVSLPDSLGGPK